MDRRTAVAGSFYPASERGLKEELKKLFSEAKGQIGGDVRALIAPHAGYLFSGEVAATAFTQIDPEREYERVFLIGASHRSHFRGAALYSSGNFLMPYGEEVVDRELSKELLKSGEGLFVDNPRYHEDDHNLEVLLPFINYRVRDGYKIVPILLGEMEQEEIERLAQLLAPHFNWHNLFVISSDFSHYPSYDDATAIDGETMEAILSGSPEKLLTHLRGERVAQVNNLVTPLCGWRAIMVLLHLMESSPNYKIESLLYKNSGDNSQYGGRDEVVGYWAASVVSKGREQRFLKRMAQLSVELSIREGREDVVSRAADMVLKEFEMEKPPAGLEREFPLFVTLTKRGALKGCIGHLRAYLPLYLQVGEVAVAAASSDYRFEPLTLGELDEVEFEISLLSPFRRVKGAEEIVLGRDGIYLKKGGRSGLFLPEVATDTGWSVEQYLGHCARDKAGIGWDGWRDKECEIYTFSSYKF